MLKAVREAKEKTSWANQNKEYEDALTKFVEGVLGSREFRNDFIPFQRKISHFGMLSSLSQTMIKLTVPGVPDTYQGNELWELNLVDPDNRRAVDYDVRRHMLAEFREMAESLSFEAPGLEGSQIPITAEYVRERLQKVLADEDLSKYIL